jgi:hypothetical protein
MHEIDDDDLLGLQQIFSIVFKTINKKDKQTWNRNDTLGLKNKTFTFFYENKIKRIWKVFFMQLLRNIFYFRLRICEQFMIILINLIVKQLFHPSRIWAKKSGKITIEIIVLITTSE